MQMSTSFNSDKQFGNIGEEFLERYAKSLMDRVLMLSRQGGDKARVEGMDFYGLIIIDAEEEPLTPEERAFCPEANKKWILKTAETAIEVKTVSNFLTRNNNNDEEAGTIEFELWTSRTKTNLGWLHGMNCPGVHNNDEKKTGQGIYVVPPTSLVYLYCDKKKKPFVSVVFEDFNALKRRLMEICPEIWPEDNGVWRIEKVNWEKQRTLLPSWGEHMWHVPFDMLSDLATVTMIDEDPVLEENEKTCALEIQRKRLAYLKKCAAGRHLNTAEEDERVRRIKEAIRQDREEKNTD